MENKELDKMVAQHLNQRKIEVSADAWGKIESQLEEKKAFAFSKIGWAAAIIVFIGLSFIFKWEKTDSTITDRDNIIPKHPIENIKTTKPAEILPVVTTETLDSKVVVAKHNEGQSSVEKINIIDFKPIIKKPNEEVVSLSHIDNIPEITENNHAIVADNNLTNHAVETDVNYSQLVMNKLNRSKTTITVDSKDLMQLAESELHTNKTVREVIVQKFKTTVQDLNIALK
jgi:hypothetical protein